MVVVVRTNPVAWTRAVREKNESKATTIFMVTGCLNVKSRRMKEIWIYKMKIRKGASRSRQDTSDNKNKGRS